MSDQCELMIGWSTVSSKDDAIQLMDQLLKESLIACGQVNGPVTSSYKWKGKTASEKEWQVTVKFNKQNERTVQKRILELHPYDTPEWVYVKAGSYAEYSNWVNDC